MRSPSGKGHNFFRWVRHSVYDDVHMDELAPTERSLSSTCASCRDLLLATRSSGQKRNKIWHARTLLLIGAQPPLLVNRCIADAKKEMGKTVEKSVNSVAQLLFSKKIAPLSVVLSM